MTDTTTTTSTPKAKTEAYTIFMTVVKEKLATVRTWRAIMGELNASMGSCDNGIDDAIDQANNMRDVFAKNAQRLFDELALLPMIADIFPSLDQMSTQTEAYEYLSRIDDETAAEEDKLSLRLIEGSYHTNRMTIAGEIMALKKIQEIITSIVTDPRIEI